MNWSDFDITEILIIGHVGQGQSYCDGMWSKAQIVECNLLQKQFRLNKVGTLNSSNLDLIRIILHLLIEEVSKMIIENNCVRNKSDIIQNL